MAVYVSTEPLSDCQIQVIEKDGEVHLVRNGHAFVKCVTRKSGAGETRDHYVEIWDIDHQLPLVSHSIRTLGWRR